MDRIGRGYFTRGAWIDWHTLVRIARAKGCADLVEKLEPSEIANWREVDAASRHLQKALSAAALKAEEG